MGKSGKEPVLALEEVGEKMFLGGIGGISNNLSELTGITIDGFTDKKRSYGSVLCFPASINSNIKGSVVLIERTHHDDSVLELISSFYLRKKLRLVDGDIVDVSILV